MNGKLLIGIVILFIHNLCSAQSMMNLDSLLNEYASSKTDTSKVLLMINIGQQYESSDPDRAKKYYEEAGKLSEELEYAKGILKYISNYTYVMNMQGDYDKSLDLNLRSVEISKELGDSLALAKCLFNVGTSYQYLNNYEAAVSYYLRGKNIFSSLNNDVLTAKASDILQTLYQKLKRYDKAIELGNEAIFLSRKYALDYELANALTNMSINYNATNEPDKAIVVLTEALSISKKTNNKYLEVSVHLNFSVAFEKKLAFKKMEEHAIMARNLAVELEDVQSTGLAIRLLSAYHLYIMENAEALKLAEASYNIFQENNLDLEKLESLSWLSKVSLVSGNVKEYLEYQKEEKALADQLLNENIQNRILEIEKKYEMKISEAKIALLEDKDQEQQIKLSNRTKLNIALISFILVIFLSAILFYKNFRQKLVIRQKRINELEIEHQLMATEAVLKGEEQERVRVARDLHDGLGGLLSGIKFSFQNMKGEMEIPPENESAYNKGMNMIDNALEEIRRIAHNMMPETLVKFGLDTALKDFCSSIDQKGTVQITYQSIGMENYNLDQSRSVSLYRIVQELVYNCLKHAQANSVIVQLIKNEDGLSLTVEDDGIGFDSKSLKKNKGIGWSNIYSRVNLLKGKLDIQSVPGKGTSVQLTCAL